MRTFTLLSLALASVLSAAFADDWPWAKYGIPQSTNPCCIPLKRTDCVPVLREGELSALNAVATFVTVSPPSTKVKL